MVTTAEKKRLPKLVTRRVGDCGCPEEVWSLDGREAVIHYEKRFYSPTINCASARMGEHRHGIICATPANDEGATTLLRGALLEVAATW